MIHIAHPIPQTAGPRRGIPRHDKLRAFFTWLPRVKYPPILRCKGRLTIQTEFLYPRYRLPLLHHIAGLSHVIRLWRGGWLSTFCRGPWGGLVLMNQWHVNRRIKGRHNWALVPIIALNCYWLLVTANIGQRNSIGIILDHRRQVKLQPISQWTQVHLTRRNGWRRIQSTTPPVLLTK